MRPTTTTAAPMTATRRAFSLVELLVVLGIIAAMAGLVLGGLFRTRDGNRLLAAEQVLADAIRQGRHTARSTGAPVELRLYPTIRSGEVVGAKMSGVSQTMLWSETFDGKHDSNEDGVVDANDVGGLTLPANGDPANGVVLGRSGNGREASADHPIPAQILPRGATIVRAGKTDGFYLACSVKPPVIPAGGTTIVLPLVIIGGDGSGEQSQCGLGLIPLQSTIQNGPGVNAVITTWELTGWVYPESGNSADIFAARDAIKTRIGREKWQKTDGTTTDEFAHGITGGEWIDVGLLYDGKRLVLYLNGERIAERTTNVPANLRADGETIHLGSRLLTTNPPTVEYAQAPIDDVRLYRLGSSDVADLPGNVVLVPSAGASASATIGWRIVCQPDGRVETYRDDDTDPRAVNDRVVKYEEFELVEDENDVDHDGNKKELIKRLKRRVGDTATIVLGQLRAPGTLQNAELTVTMDGRVLSRLITNGTGTGTTNQQGTP